MTYNNFNQIVLTLSVMGFDTVACTPEPIAVHALRQVLKVGLSRSDMTWDKGCFASVFLFSSPAADGGYF